jgi:hypothetical protein
MVFNTPRHARSLRIDGRHLGAIGARHELHPQTDIAHCDLLISIHHAKLHQALYDGSFLAWLEIEPNLTQASHVGIADDLPIGAGKTFSDPVLLGRPRRPPLNPINLPRFQQVQKVCQNWLVRTNVGAR